MNLVWKLGTNQFDHQGNLSGLGTCTTWDYFSQLVKEADLYGFEKMGRLNVQEDICGKNLALKYRKEAHFNCNH